MDDVETLQDNNSEFLFAIIVCGHYTVSVFWVPNHDGQDHFSLFSGSDIYSSLAGGQNIWSCI